MWYPYSLNAEIWHVISKLNEQSTKEKRGEVEVAPGQEMLAITADTGMFFSILLKAIKARHILEIGTSVGFSTLWFADALVSNDNIVVTTTNESKRRRRRRAPPSSSIITVEMNHLKVQRAKKNFEEAGVSGLIEIREGAAIDILRQLRATRLTKSFDFVFFDADKENLIEYFDLALPLVRIGGIIAVDNMLYPEHFRPEMKKYASYVRSKPNVQSVTVPIGNGEEITIKLGEGTSCEQYSS